MKTHCHLLFFFNPRVIKYINISEATNNKNKTINLEFSNSAFVPMLIQLNLHYVNFSNMKLNDKSDINNSKIKINFTKEQKSPSNVPNDLNHEQIQ